MADFRALYEGPASAGRSIAQAREARADRNFSYYDTDQERALRYFQAEQQQKQFDQMQQRMIAIENARLGESAADREQRERIAVRDQQLGEARLDPRRFDPVPSRNLPGTYFSPGTGQVIQPEPEPPKTADPNAAVPLTDPTGATIGHKVILNGKETLVKPPAASPLAGMFGGQPAASAPAGQAPAAAKPAPSAAPPVINSKAERDALPSGAIYTGPDGKRYRKK